MLLWEKNDVKQGVHKEENSWASPAALPVLLALALDTLGELPAALHPVVWYGKLIKYLEGVAPAGRHAQLLYGTAMLLFSAPFALFPALLLHRLAQWARSSTKKHNRYYSSNLAFALIEAA